MYPCARGGVYDKLVSQPLLPGSMWAYFLFIQRVARVVSGFLSEEVVSYVAVDLVCPYE